MKKENGKEIYTFTGLINRMDACKYRSYSFTEKDIPDEVEFMGSIYELNYEKNSYYLKGAVVPFALAEAVAKEYGNNLSKYITSYEFIVTPKEKVFLTSEEKEFLRMCNTVLRGGMGIKSIKAASYISTDDTIDNLLCMRFKDGKQLYVPIGMHAFDGMSAGTEYTLKDLKIYD
jgi:hypothetical protein